MNIDIGTIAIPALGLAFFWAIVNAIGVKKAAGDAYKQTDIMTPNELEFFARLEEALPDYYIFPQVSLGAIISPAVRRSSKDWMRQFNVISSQRPDFAIYTKKMKLVALIELDDKTHKAGKDKIRDGRTKSAGIPTIRYESRDKPELGTIQRDIKSLSSASQAKESISRLSKWAQRSLKTVEREE